MRFKLWRLNEIWYELRDRMTQIMLDPNQWFILISHGKSVGGLSFESSVKFYVLCNKTHFFYEISLYFATYFRQNKKNFEKRRGFLFLTYLSTITSLCFYKSAMVWDNWSHLQGVIFQNYSNSTESSNSREDPEELERNLAKWEKGFFGNMVN